MFGFCGGLQFMGATLGARLDRIGGLDDGEVDPHPTFEAGWREELGYQPVELIGEHLLLAGLGPHPVFRHAHTSELKDAPDGFVNLARTDVTELQYLAHETLPPAGTQFHPEHWTDEHPAGRRLIANFCDWSGVTRTVDASADTLYALVTDITRMPEWSCETFGTHWLDGATSAEVGARFAGKNRLGRNSWTTKPTIVAADRGQVFAFEVPGKSERAVVSPKPAGAETRVTAAYSPRLQRSSNLERTITPRRGVGMLDLVARSGLGTVTSNQRPETSLRPVRPT